MSTSIEARVPFLDHRLLEFTTHIPSALRVRHGRTKHILKKAVADLVPAHIVHHGIERHPLLHLHINGIAGSKQPGTGVPFQARLVQVIVTVPFGLAAASQGQQKPDNQSITYMRCVLYLQFSECCCLPQGFKSYPLFCG